MLVESRDMKSNVCPCCAVIRGDKPRLKNSLCKDCLDNWGLVQEWEWHKMLISHKKIKKLPFIITAFVPVGIAMWINEGFGWLGLIFIFVLGLASMSMWRSYWKMNLEKDMDESKQKMFLKKVEGVVRS